MGYSIKWYDKWDPLYYFVLTTWVYCTEGLYFHFVVVNVFSFAYSRLSRCFGECDILDHITLSTSIGLSKLLLVVSCLPMVILLPCPAISIDISRTKVRMYDEISVFVMG